MNKSIKNQAPSKLNKLSLAHETLRQLNNQELIHAVGGISGQVGPLGGSRAVACCSF